MIWGLSLWICKIGVIIFDILNTSPYYDVFLRALTMRDRMSDIFQKFDFLKDDQPVRRRWKWLLYALWGLTIFGFLTALIMFITLSRGDIPSFADLENPTYDLASIVYDEKGESFGKYYIENRENIAYDQLSPKVVNALLATEDDRFMSHSGIDLRALFRVGVKTILLSKDDSGGGSTISQQLAKLLFSRPNLKGGFIGRAIGLVKVKLKEWIVAAKLEKSYTKEEIIAMYLNKFEFINGAHGIQAASETYFSKNQDELEDDEVATLIGMLKNPSLYNPRRFPEKAKDRRNTVLALMENNDLITEELKDSLSAKEIDMSNFKRETQSEGSAPYFRSELTKYLRNLFKQEGIEKAEGGQYNIYKDGLKIYTTIDLNYQRIAEKSLIDHMEWNQERYWRVWKGMDPWTHEADSLQLEIRKDILSRNIKASDRYLNLRNTHLGSSIADIRKSYGNLPLSDNVIKALVKIENKQSSFRKQIAANKLKLEDQDEFKRLLNDDKWTTLRENWDDLTNTYEQEFKMTKIKMMVYDYGEEKEVEKEMTPYDSVRYHNQHLQAGLLAVEPQTGYIKAWVGGINHKYFKYDHVNSRRQVGSTIKPFVYATAISLQGISPCQEYEDISYSIAPGDANFNLDEQWSPANANEEFSGNKYNLWQGLLYSKNSITVRLVKEMGNVEVIRELLDNAGISKSERYPNGRLVVPRVPSICLGAMDLTLKEMAGAYTTFANNGTYTEPIFIKRIEDKNGKVIYTGIPDRKLALNPIYNSVMLEMLKNNLGGGFNLGTKSPVGGKTGTTNDYADGWFMGVTPELVVGTWVGGDDKWIRFLSLDDGQGFVMARPIVSNFLQDLEKDSLAGFNAKAKFPTPPRGFYDLVDCDRYKQIKPEEEQARILEEKASLDVFDTDDIDEEIDAEIEEELEAELEEELDAELEEELEGELEEELEEEMEEETEEKPSGGGGGGE
jgi:penicillin-binding protein 1A